MNNQIQKTMMESLKAFYQQALGSGKYKASHADVSWSIGDEEHQSSIIQPNIGIDTNGDVVNVLIENTDGFVKSFNIDKLISFNLIEMDEQAGFQFTVTTTDSEECSVLVGLVSWSIYEEPFKTAMIVQLPDDVEYEEAEDYLNHEHVYDLVPNDQGRVLYVEGSNTKLRFNDAEWIIDPRGDHVVTLASDDESLQLNLRRL